MELIFGSKENCVDVENDKIQFKGVDLCGLTFFSKMVSHPFLFPAKINFTIPVCRFL